MLLSLISAEHGTPRLTISPTPCSTEITSAPGRLHLPGRELWATGGVNYRELRFSTFGRAVAEHRPQFAAKRLLGHRAKMCGIVERPEGGAELKAKSRRMTPPAQIPDPGL